MYKLTLMICLFGLLSALGESSKACSQPIFNSVILQKDPYAITFLKSVTCQADDTTMTTFQITLSRPSTNLFFGVSQNDFDPAVPGQQEALIKALSSGPSDLQMSYFKGPLVEQIDSVIDALNAGAAGDEASSLCAGIHAAMKDAVLYIQ